MEVINQIQLKFHGVDFPTINLNSNKPIFKAENSKVNIDIKPMVFYPKEQPSAFKIIQEIHLSAENFFDLFILAVGTFELNTDIDEKTKKNFVNINAPAIMFPYVRAFITTLTANLGNVTGTLTIPTQFFNGELAEVRDNVQE